MANLMQIKQSKNESTHDYICRFENELDKVESFDETWLLKIFIWGLPSDQAVLVSQRRPRTLSEAFQIARDAALAAQMSRRPGGSKDEKAGAQKRDQGQHQKQQANQGGRGAGQVQKQPNVIFYSQNAQRYQGGRGRGQAGKPPVPPPAPAVIVQSQQRQQAGSGQRGRGRGNQRKSRVAVMATVDDEGEAGLEGQEAAQHAAGHGTDASLHQRQGN